MNEINWLPKKITRDDNLRDKAYLCFIKDFKKNELWLDSKKVIINNDAQATFKHLTTQGHGNNREHCNQRCERIPWIKAIIQNVKTEKVNTWIEPQNGTDIYYLTLEDFSYLIILKSSNSETIGLATAYCIDDDYKKDLNNRFQKYREKSHYNDFKKNKKRESMDDIYEHFLKLDGSK